MNNGAVYIRKLQNLHRDSIPGRWEESTGKKGATQTVASLVRDETCTARTGPQNRIEPTLYIEESFNDTATALRKR